MKKIRILLDYVTIGGLTITSLVSGITFLLLLASLIFSFNPWIKTKNGGFGITGYDKESIPLNYESNSNLPDTSIYYKTKHGSGLFIKSYLRSVRAEPQDSITYADTITTKYNDYEENKFEITGVIFQKGKILIKPRNIKEKIILSIPMLLILGLVCYGCWQIAKFLNYIVHGMPFASSNFHILLKVGWSIVLVFLTLFFYDLIISSKSSIRLSFYSTIPNFRSPFSQGIQIKTRPNVSWLIIGCFLIILALAFKKGTKIQQEQDLTV